MSFCVRRMLSEGATPLAVAAARGQIELVRLLLDRGADVNTSTRSGQTPVLLAAWAGHDEITRLLLRFGADINRGQSDEAVLITWASQGYPSLVRALLDRGAAIDARDDRGRTPLIRTVAAQRTFVPEVPPSYRDTVSLLLQRGADPNAQTSTGSRP